MDVLSAEEVGSLLLYVAPGYFAAATYRHRFPQRPAEQFAILVPAVAASVPLVAVTDWIRGWGWLEWERNPLSAKYVALLLGVAVVAGYAAAAVRDARWLRSALSRIGVTQEPEHSVLELVLRSLRNPEAQLTLTMKDGKVVAGTPQSWKSDPEVKLREIYLTHSTWYEEGSPGRCGLLGGWREEPKPGGWRPRRTTGGVLVNIADVAYVEVDPVDPEEP